MTASKVCQGDTAERAIQADFRVMETSCLIVEKKKQTQRLKEVKPSIYGENLGSMLEVNTYVCRLSYTVTFCQRPVPAVPH